MFGIRNLPHLEGRKRIEFKDPNPLIIQGADVFDTLCPVSKLTGVRENPVSLLSRVLDPSKARALDVVLQQLPTLRSEDPSISDADALDMLASRLETGTPAEDALVRERLVSIADVLLQPVVQSDGDQQNIAFDSSDANNSD